MIHRTTKPWACLAGVEFSTDDPTFAEWRLGRGMYCSNGAAVALIRRSSSAREALDLFAMSLLTRFGGYFSGYSKDIRASRSDLSFALLKAHTLNHGGFVTLRSLDPAASAASRAERPISISARGSVPRNRISSLLTPLNSRARAQAPRDGRLAPVQARQASLFPWQLNAFELSDQACLYEFQITL